MKHALTQLLLLGALVQALFAQNNATSQLVRLSVANDLRDMERALDKTAASAGIAQYQDLAAKTLRVLDRGLPVALAQYDETLRGENGLLYSDAGRFLAKNPDVVETVMRYVTESRLPLSGGADPNELDSTRIDFGENERKQRSQLVEQSALKLAEFEGNLFDPNESTSARTIIANARWASRAFDLIDSRNRLLEQYALAVPEGIEVSGQPTLEEEILQTFARRIAAGEQLINQVEREAARTTCPRSRQPHPRHPRRRTPSASFLHESAGG